MTGERDQRGAWQAPADGPSSGGGPAGQMPVEQEFDAGSLYALRSAVAAHASAAGLSQDRVYGVTAAAHEMAANVVRHGAGHGRLHLWAADGVLTCQVTDNGPSNHDTPWPVQHGHGLWVIGQVADQFTIDSGPGGTTVTATFALRPEE